MGGRVSAAARRRLVPNEDRRVSAPLLFHIIIYYEKVLFILAIVFMMCGGANQFISGAHGHTWTHVQRRLGDACAGFSFEYKFVLSFSNCSVCDF